MHLTIRDKLLALSLAIVIHAAFVISFKPNQQGVTVTGLEGMQFTLAPSPSEHTIQPEVVEAEEVEVIEIEEETTAIDIIEAKPIKTPANVPTFQATVEPKPKTKKPTVKEPPREKKEVVNTTSKQKDYTSNKQQSLTSGAISQTGINQQAQQNYQAIVHALLVKHKKYPPRALSRRQEGIVTIKFTVEKSGKITSYELTSSGFKLLDRAVEKIIKKVSPLPPFPANLKKDSITLIVPISFSIKT